MEELEGARNSSKELRYVERRRPRPACACLDLNNAFAQHGRLNGFARQAPRARGAEGRARGPAIYLASIYLLTTHSVLFLL